MSSCIAMSAPICPCTCMATSGVSTRFDPSRCDRNVKPSSDVVRRSERENAWKPPESVSIACGHREKRCRPPALAMISGPGRNHRWYVLPSTTRAPVAATSAGTSVLTDPCVPTGMNVGVGTSPCGVVSTPARAWPSVASRR